MSHVLEQTISRPTWLSGSLLVAGACIGGGMLVMPIQTAEAGFLVSALAILLSWIFMTFTGLLLVESTLWMKQNAHFSSLTATLLGRGGKVLSLAVYLFMNYASLVAYTSGGATLMNEWFGGRLGYEGGCALFTAVFGLVVYLGASLIGKTNALFVGILTVLYGMLVFVGLPHVQREHLAFQWAWKQGFYSLPLILAAFSYQMIVPSLCSYLQYRVQELKRSVIVGTAIPFAVYFLWLLVIHGVVPLEGEHGLREAFLKGAAATEPLKHRFQSSVLGWLSDGFAFFALVTSYLGLSLGLSDFLRDLFKERQLGKRATTVLALVPSVLLAVLYPRALLEFLDLSGGFGDALLSGLIPVAMVWIGRYRKGLRGEYEAPGKKWGLWAAGLFAVSVFVLQLVKLF